MTFEAQFIIVSTGIILFTVCICSLTNNEKIKPDSTADSRNDDTDFNYQGVRNNRR